MGFESFRVELRGGRATYADADAAIRKLVRVEPDPHSLPIRGSTYYLVDDGRHVIEVELMDRPVRVSCRFTLCHPPSVDSAFLALVRELMRGLGMQIRICDDVRPDEAHLFYHADDAEFSVLTLRTIAARRAEWIETFGTEQLSATTNEVYERVILSRCQPVVEQPLRDGTTV